MIVAGAIKDLIAAVHLAADMSQVASGTIFCVIRLESDDADDGKFWDADDDTWQTNPVAWPEATHFQAALWRYTLPADASDGKFRSSIHFTFTDDLTEATATTVCMGSSHDVVESFSVWDALLIGATHNLPTSAGRKLRELASPITHAALAQGPGVGNNQVQLAATASAIDGAYDPSVIAIIAGTGAGQARYILQYDGTTKIAVVGRDWKVNPDATSDYIVIADPGHEHVHEGLAQAGGVNTITLNPLASTVSGVYIGQSIFIRGGTGADQMGYVIAYDGATKIATIAHNWTTQPDGTSGYVMLPTGYDRVTVADILVDTDEIQGKLPTGNICNEPDGARQITIHTEDALSASIVGAQVSIYDELNTTFISRGTTDVSGNYVVALDDGTYSLRIVKDLFGFTTPETIVVSADGTKTITGAAFTAPTPSAANLCVIYGTLRDAAGVIHDGVCVEIYGVTPQAIGVVQITERIAHVFTDAIGYFQIELEIEARVNVTVKEAGIDAVKDVPDAANQIFATWADAVL